MANDLTNFFDQEREGMKKTQLKMSSHFGGSFEKSEMEGI